MRRVILSLGSNLGDREFYLNFAIKQLKRVLFFVKYSSVFETKSLYNSLLPNFLNQAFLGFTTMNHYEFWKHTQKLQKTMGRDASYNFDPMKKDSRYIDIDIIDFDSIILNHNLPALLFNQVNKFSNCDLILPHPRLHERLFVLEPMIEICPDWICPRSQKNLETLIQEIKTQNINNNGN